MRLYIHWCQINLTSVGFHPVSVSKQELNIRDCNNISEGCEDGCVCHVTTVGHLTGQNVRGSVSRVTMTPEPVCPAPNITSVPEV